MSMGTIPRIMKKIEMLEKLAVLKAAQRKLAQSRQRLRAEIARREKEDNKALAITIGFAMMAHRRTPRIRAGLDTVVADSLIKPPYLGLLKELLGETDAGQPLEVPNPSLAKR
jgi:hypothetical protein